MNNGAGFAVGSSVVLTEEYVALVERADLRNVICEVVDARLANGGTIYKIAPISGFGGVDPSGLCEVFADDIRKAVA